MDGNYIVFLLITLVFRIKAKDKGGAGMYPGSDYYWPMSITNNTMIKDEESDVEADLHGVQFIEVPRLKYAASLKHYHWIDVDGGVTEDCLAFQFSSSSCDDTPALSVAFWIRMSGGKRVIATGCYTNSSDGPGILIEYDEKKQELKVFFTSMKKRWETSIHLPKHSWCHVTATWSEDSGNGLRVVLDGKYDKPRYHSQDKHGKEKISSNQRYSKMITIGLPLDMSRKKDYGRFDIAHLVFFFLELVNSQLRYIPKISLGHHNDDTLACCTRKSKDKCYKNPCPSKDCANIEWNYRDCVCEELKHKTCEVSSISMSTPVTTKRITSRTSTSSTSTSSHECPRSELNRHNVNGCGNSRSNGLPVCTGSSTDVTCFYGTCRSLRNKKKRCFCPKCNNVSKLTCGDNGITYLNPCVLKRTSCIKKYKIVIANRTSCVKFGSTILKDASYYWPFNKILQKGDESLVEEAKGNKKEYLHNGGKIVSTRQLGNVLLLNGGKKQWVDIKSLKDPCIWKAECVDGISVGFWINFISVDYIFAAGGYADSTAANGFRLQRDNETKYHTLEVANNDSKWQIYIEPFPKKWVYLSFSWRKDKGLKLYFNGELAFSSNKRTSLRARVQKGSYDTMIIGRTDYMELFGNYGYFKIAHLAVWKKALSDDSFRAAYSAHVIRIPGCCYSMNADNISDPCSQKTATQKDMEDCICPGNLIKSRRCEKEDKEKAKTGCKDKLKYCRRLACNQDFCQNKYPMYENMCLETCGKCGNETALVDSKCYYGTCKQVNDKDECSCPSRCNNDTLLTCGDDGFTYQNPCVLKRYSCRMNQNIQISHRSSCTKSGSLADASYYWPFNKIVEEGGEDMVKEERNNRKEYVRNKAKVVTTDQLGSALLLDGREIEQWVDIKGLKDPCIWKVECDDGISVGFWINFISGDYILAAGGYAATSVANGFRLQRDKETGYHTLEVANNDSKWQIYIEPFPKRWMYLSFSWRKDEGLKLYFNGELTFETNKRTNPVTVQKRNGGKVTHDGMFIGRRDSMQQFEYSGSFKIAHLAIWKKALSANEFMKAYKANVNVTGESTVCCYHAREAFVKNPCHPKKPASEWDNVTCICPGITTESRMCDNRDKLPVGCKDELMHCKKLDTNQDFCKSKDPRYEAMCNQTCGRCGVAPTPTPLHLFGPKQHFTPQTLIFALLGCVGGLVILLGVTVYFWKVYRTRYQGAFIPTVKNVSLLDVSDYEDEKWPNKYIDSASYYIKDVPPKKRALPLIPAKITTQNMYRYQPPEFD